MAQQFQKWLVELVERAGGWRRAAGQARLSHSTLMKAAGRIEGSIDLETLKKISDWSRAPLSYVLGLYYGTTTVDQRVEMELSRLRESHPELRDALTLAAELGEDSLRDVLEYIYFKAGVVMQRNRD